MTTYNTIPIFHASDIHLVITGYKTSHPDVNDNKVHNEWAVIVVQKSGKQQDVVLAWCPTRDSARKLARKTAKLVKCKVREESRL